MKFSAGCLQWPPTEASRCYEFYRQTHDVLNQNLEQRDVLCFQNEHSDERLEQHQQEPTIRASREQSQPLQQYTRRLSKKVYGKRENGFGARVRRLCGYRLGGSQACVVSTSGRLEEARKR